MRAAASPKNHVTSGDEERDASPTFIIMCVTFNERNVSVHAHAHARPSARFCSVNKTRRFPARKLIPRLRVSLRVATLKRSCFRPGSSVARTGRSLMTHHPRSSRVFDFARGTATKSMSRSRHINWISLSFRRDTKRDSQTKREFIGKNYFGESKEEFYEK